MADAPVDGQNDGSPFSSLPVALEPVYWARSPVESIELLNGNFTLSQATVNIVGSGIITWNWFPRPSIIVSIDDGIDVMRLQGGEAEVHVSELRLRVGITNRQFAQDAGAPVKSTVKSHPLSIVDSGQLSGMVGVRFHVANFWEYFGTAIRNAAADTVWRGRATLANDQWIVTIDALDLGKNKESFHSTLQDGSYGFTHVGEIKRTDGGGFAIADVEGLVDALYWMLSFVRGNWTAPSLLVAFNESGQRQGERWKEQKIYRWRGVQTWFNTMSVEGLTALFPGVMRVWNDALWHEPIRLAIHWYVESNLSAGGLEGSIILQQAAFELLAWTLLVEDRKLLSVDGFNALPASDKLRLALSECGIPLSINPSLEELSKRAKAYGWTDGPEALVRTRNALVHPTPKKRAQILGHDEESRAARYDTWCLSTWYHELLILHQFGYKGHYSNRLVRGGWKGTEVESVPWAKA